RGLDGSRWVVRGTCAVAVHRLNARVGREALAVGANVPRQPVAASSFTSPQRPTPPSSGCAGDELVQREVRGECPERERVGGCEAAADEGLGDGVRCPEEGAGLEGQGEGFDEGAGGGF